MNIPKYPNVQQVRSMNKSNKIFSPNDAKIYNAGQRGVTGKPFSPGWSNQVTNNINKLMTVGSYKKGGIVKETGLAKVHKGELIIPADQVANYHAKKGNTPFKSPQSKWRFDMTGGRML